MEWERVRRINMEEGAYQNSTPRQRFSRRKPPSQKLLSLAWVLMCVAAVVCFLPLLAYMPCHTLCLLAPGCHKNWWSHIDASHSRQPLVKGERLVRYEVNAVIASHDVVQCPSKQLNHQCAWNLRGGWVGGWVPTGRIWCSRGKSRRTMPEHVPRK